jgi:hypothetical protein
VAGAGRASGLEFVEKRSRRSDLDATRSAPINDA